MKQYIYKLIAIAGTFDRLHKGHRYFISQAFKFGQRVIIGLTSDTFVIGKFKNSRLSGIHDAVMHKTLQTVSGQNSKLKTNVNNYETRKRELERFLEQERLLGRAEIVKIDDVYGPAVGREDLEALIVTSDTLSGGQKVNIRRRQLGFKLLKLLKVPQILAEDQKRIASTRIRIGEIDRLGTVFQSHISENLRQELKKPLGELIKGDSNNLKGIAEKLKKAVGKTNSIMISTVGDEVTKLCNEIGITINLAIFDYRVGRKKKYHSLSELGFLNSKALKTPQGWQAASHDSPGVEESVRRVNNPPGHITQKLVEAVRHSYSRIINSGKQQIIEVIGEEDLAGVPAILLAPLGSVILYGQPGVGVVMVEVTEEKKSQLMKLIGENK